MLVVIFQLFVFSSDMFFSIYYACMASKQGYEKRDSVFICVSVNVMNVLYMYVIRYCRFTSKMLNITICTSKTSGCLIFLFKIEFTAHFPW